MGEGRPGTWLPAAYRSLHAAGGAFTRSAHGPLRMLSVGTSLEWVRFWCLARSEALEKALLQPSCSHT